MTSESGHNLQAIIDHTIFDPHDPNFVEETRRIADLACDSDWDFIIHMMKVQPALATAIVFVAYRSASRHGMGWVNDHLAPHVRGEEITFLDPHIFSSCDYGFQGPWTYEVVAQFADAEASFEQFVADNETEP